MSLRAEFEALRRHLEELAEANDEAFVKRYALRRPPLPRTLYWRLRWFGARFLRWLEAMGIKRPHPWPTALVHVPASGREKPLLIWAVGADHATLREACHGFSKLQDALPGFAPVLVTDIADFAFFSRLGWLVEFLPKLSGTGEPYEAIKARFLARLYRDAPALPLRAGLEAESSTEEIRRWVAEWT